MTNAEPSPREQLKQAKLAAAQDRVALKELLAPVRGRTALAQACFDFLPTRAVLDLMGWDDDADIFRH